MRVWVLFHERQEWDDAPDALHGFTDPVTAEKAAEALNADDRYERWGVAEVEVDGPWTVRFRAVLDVIDGQPDPDRYASSRYSDGGEPGTVVEWWGKAGAMRDGYECARLPADRDRRPMCRIEAWAATPPEALALAAAREAELIADWETHLALHALEGAFA